MSYEKQNFVNGQKLMADHLNLMDDQVALNIENIDQLSNAIDDLKSIKAGAIVETASGDIITLDNTSDQPLLGLRVFGKSTQDGMPTPDAPVPIVSAFEDGGGVAVTGKNLIPGAGRTYNGLTTTNNADGSVTVSGSVAADGSALVYLFLSTAASNYTKIWCNPTRPLKVTLYKDGAVYTNTFTTRYKTRDGVSVYNPVSGVYFDAVYIQKTLTAGDTSLCGTYRIQVEFGSAATDYEPYTGQTLSIDAPLYGIPVTSGGNYTDADGQMWVCDEVDFSRGVRVQRVKTLVYDGTEYWRVETSGAAFAHITYSPIINNDLREFVVCSHCERKYIGIDSQHIGVDLYKSGILRLRLGHETSADAVKAFLAGQYAAGTPLTVSYILAEPVETLLTESELAACKALRTNYPNTTIYTDDNAGLAVQYKADTKAYIDKKFSELATAIVNN